MSGVAPDNPGHEFCDQLHHAGGEQVSVPGAASSAHEELSAFREKLRELRIQVGSPSLRDLDALARTFGCRLPRSSIQDKLYGKTMPDLDFVLAFVRACLLRAKKMGLVLPHAMSDLGAWEEAQLKVVRAADRARADLSVAAWADRELRRQPGRAWIAPRQLPHSSRHFVGRAAEQEALTRMLGRVGGAGTVVISSIDGAAGIGKTALALHWAHQFTDKFPDGQLYLNLRGFDPVAEPVTPDDAIRVLLDGMGVPPDAVPITIEAQIALYRSLFTGRRVLVLLDNAATAEQVRPLLPSSPTAHVLVTSRNRLTGLVAIDGAEQLTIGLLSAGEARQLLYERLGSGRVDLTDALLNEIVRSCARLPLALGIVAGHVATRPGMPLAEVARLLTNDRLGTLDGGEPVARVRAVFSWSYRALGSATAQLFRLLSLHPGPHVSAAVAASLAGIPIQQAQALLTELASVNLLAELMPGRFASHDLLRVYAAEEAEQNETQDRRRSAFDRMLDYYLHTAHSASMMLYASREPITLTPAAAGTAEEIIADHRQAMAWFSTEHAALLSIFHDAATALRHVYTWQLAWALTIYFDRKGLWDDLVKVQRTALTAAQQANDLTGQVRAHHNLVHALIRLERLDDAYADLLQLLELNLLEADEAQQAHTYADLAEVLERQGKYAEALRYAQLALDFYQATNHPRGQAAALGAIGWLQARVGNRDEALVLCGQALTQFQKLGNAAGQAALWGRLGRVHQDLRHYQDAVSCYRNALDIYRDHDDQYSEADILYNLGHTYHCIADTDAARALWQQALDIFTEIGHPAAEQVRARLVTLDK